MFKYHIFRVYNRKRRIEFNSTLNINYNEALGFYCDYIIDYILNYTEYSYVTRIEIEEIIKKCFSDRDNEDPILLKIYQSTDDGKLRSYSFPIDSIVEFVNTELSKYGSD